MAEKYMALNPRTLCFMRLTAGELVWFRKKRRRGLSKCRHSEGNNTTDIDVKISGENVMQYSQSTKFVHRKGETA